MKYLVQEKKMFFFYIALLIGITCFAFYPALHFDFTNWDDNVLVTQNDVIRSLSFSAILKMFTAFLLNHYHPLVTLSFALEYALFGLNPSVFHLTNIVLHAANTVLVVVLIAMITKNNRIALIAGALFALHPARVESVAWIAERKDVLSTFFMLISFCAYILYRRTPRTKYLLIVLLSFLAALFSKAIAVTLPVLFFTYDYYEEGKITKERIQEKIPFLFLSCIFGFIAVMAQYSSGVTPKDPAFHVVKSIFLVSYSFLYYCIQFVFPAALSPIHPYPEALGESYSLFFWLSPVVVAGIVFVVYRFGRYNRLLISALMLYTIAILPVLQFIPVGRMIVADHFSYFPAIGLALASGYGFSMLIDHVTSKKIGIVVILAGVVVVCVFLVMTRRELTAWQNSVTLWSRVVSDHPAFAEGYSNLGISFAEEKNSIAAFDNLDRAIALDSTDAEYFYNRGLLCVETRHHEKAIHDFSKVIEMHPDNLVAYIVRGNEYFDNREFRDAIMDYSHILTLRPNAPLFQHKRAQAYMNIGEYDAAWNDLHASRNSRFDGDSIILKGVEYVCSDGTQLRAILEARQAIVFLDAKPIVLPRTVSADGVRFSNGTVVLWLKGREAFVGIGEKILHKGCQLMNEES